VDTGKTRALALLEDSAAVLVVRDELAAVTAERDEIRNGA
jgi:hypothetical protein